MKLYLDGKYFLCRKCNGLAYNCQRETKSFRLLNRANKIRDRLGGMSGSLNPFPEKPKGMHWKTYMKLRNKAIDAEYESLLEAAKKFNIKIN